MQRWNNERNTIRFWCSRSKCVCVCVNTHSFSVFFFFPLENIKLIHTTARINVIAMSVVLDLLFEWKSPIICIEPLDFLIRNIWIKYEMNRLKFKQTYLEQRQSNMNHLFGINLNLLIRTKEKIKRSMLIGFEFNMKFYLINCLRICAN